MPIFGEKPVTSITIKINQLSTPNRNGEIDETLELYLSDLLQLIQIQPSTGAVEAARAIRKNIKYGDSVHQQIGPTVARDDKLLDVLKGIIDGSGRTGIGLSYDRKVQSKVRAMAAGWKHELDGMDGYKTPSANVFESDKDQKASSRRSAPHTPELDKRTPPPRPKTASPYSKNDFADGRAASDKKDKRKKRRRRKTGKNGVIYADEQFKIPQINYKAEAPKIRTVIADCVTHTTALNNLLIALPKDVSPLDDKKTSNEFDKCRSIRRKVLRYLQYVGAGDPEAKSKEVLAMDEEFLGSLIGANEQLVTAFTKFDQACGYNDSNPAPNYDEEDENYDSEGYESYYTDESSDQETVDDESIDTRLGGLNIQEGSSSSLAAKKSPPPPRPAKNTNFNELSEPQKPNFKRTNTNNTVESDPFGDSHAAL
ncbi:hypothetical protein QCA50_019035 [Cerrena zonata]|uniref:LAS seventeen-binding protein 5 n=1 Tax=Cerrena zonata TaxID=2478898 RepID=A0AAW0FET0_9APHY